MTLKTEDEYKITLSKLDEYLRKPKATNIVVQFRNNLYWTEILEEDVQTLIQEYPPWAEDLLAAYNEATKRLLAKVEEKEPK